MNSVSALIVDDESAARSRLKRLLAKDNRINVLGEARDAGLGLDWEFLKFYGGYPEDTLYNSSNSRP